jgi:hypothetical protein
VALCSTALSIKENNQHHFSYAVFGMLLLIMVRKWISVAIAA